MHRYTHTRASFYVLHHPTPLTPASLPPCLPQGRSPNEYKVTMGTCVNWDKLNGVEDIVSMAQAQASFDVPVLLQLLQESDFLGVSNYPSVGDGNSPPPRTWPASASAASAVATARCMQPPLMLPRSTLHACCPGARGGGLVSGEW
jgi:hypothetical protein